MNRLDRLTSILIHLQSKRVIKAQELADRFEISLRTVYRDIRSLEQAGVPIGAEAGIGYFLADGFHLPPVMFSQEEARALIMGSKLVAKYTDPSIQKAFESALIKIKAAMDDPEQESLTDLEPNILVQNLLDNDGKSDHLQALQAAMAERKMVKIKYYANYNERWTEREVEPIGLSHQGYGWHLIAYCRLREDYRDFRTDRIFELELLKKSYSPHKRISLETYYQQLKEKYQLFEVHIRFDRQIRPYLGEQKYLMGFVGEELYENYFDAYFLVFNFDVFSRWLLMYGDSMRIQSPEELRSSFNEILRKISSRQQIPQAY